MISVRRHRDCDLQSHYTKKGLEERLGQSSSTGFFTVSELPSFLSIQQEKGSSSKERSRPTMKEPRGGCDRNVVKRDGDVG
ncbi:hypothetical protein M5K25_006138 [Dendrobium thyrsiflorum]|uniref:Uncharacterized protein n=1 Tax=Dendrobium thyrsiflorum TaxID=117978 RepID=A0ABD0VC53_DENTH